MVVSNPAWCVLPSKCSAGARSLRPKATRKSWRPSCPERLELPGDRGGSGWWVCFGITLESAEFIRRQNSSEYKMFCIVGHSGSHSCCAERFSFSSSAVQREHGRCSKLQSAVFHSSMQSFLRSLSPSWRHLVLEIPAKESH